MNPRICPLCLCSDEVEYFSITKDSHTWYCCKGKHDNYDAPNGENKPFPSPLWFNERREMETDDGLCSVRFELAYPTETTTTLGDNDDD